MQALNNSRLFLVIDQLASCLLLLHRMVLALGSIWDELRRYNLNFKNNKITQSSTKPPPNHKRATLKREFSYIVFILQCWWYFFPLIERSIKNTTFFFSSFTTFCGHGPWNAQCVCFVFSLIWICCNSFPLLLCRCTGSLCFFFFFFPWRNLSF